MPASPSITTRRPSAWRCQAETRFALGVPVDERERPERARRRRCRRPRGRLHDLAGADLLVELGRLGERATPSSRCSVRTQARYCSMAAARSPAHAYSCISMRWPDSASGSSSRRRRAARSPTRPLRPVRARAPPVRGRRRARGAAPEPRRFASDRTPRCRVARIPRGSRRGRARPPRALGPRRAAGGAIEIQVDAVLVEAFTMSRDAESQRAPRAARSTDSVRRNAERPLAGSYRARADQRAARAEPVGR